MKFYKPAIKGSILTAIGIYITRDNIGVGRLTTNLYFGMLSFFLMALSGLVLIHIFQPKEEGNALPLKKGIIIFAGLFTSGVILTITNILLYNLSIFILFILVIIGSIWCVLGFLVSKKRDEIIIPSITITLAFSLGIFYGAILNVLFFPLYIYLIFISVSSLQLSREFTKHIAKEKGAKGIKDWLSRKNIKNRRKELLELDSKQISLLKKSELLQIIAVAPLILIIFAGVSNPVLYLYPMILCLIFIGLALYFTLKSISKNQFFNNANSLLKYGILFQMIALIAIG